MNEIKQAHVAKHIAVYHTDADYARAVVETFQAGLPDYEVKAWAEGEHADFLVAWKPKPELFKTPGLQTIFALGAGVDAFLAADLPESVTLVRLEEAGMGAQMLEFALYAILYHSRGLGKLRVAQKNEDWQGSATPARPPFSTPIGVLGLGQLGGYVATHLSDLGYPVSGYSRSPKRIAGVETFSGDGLAAFLAQSEVLINLLPLTAETEGFLNADLFAKLPKGAFIVNLARGKQLVEADLIAALDNGQLSGAFLDVFAIEPLPKGHAFWQDERIIITPHIAAITFKEDALAQIKANLAAYQKGEAMRGVVDRQRGY